MKNEIFFCNIKINNYLCNRISRVHSSVGLEHLPYKQRVGGSTPSEPTKSQGGSFILQRFSSHFSFPFLFHKLFFSIQKQVILLCFLLCLCGVELLGQTAVKRQNQVSNSAQKTTVAVSGGSTTSTIPKRPRTKKTTVAKKKPTTTKNSNPQVKVQKKESVQQRSEQSTLTPVQKVFQPFAVIEDKEFIFSLSKLDNELTASIGAYYGGKQLVAFGVIDYLRQKGYFNNYKNVDATSSSDYIRLTYIAKIVVPMKIRAEYFNGSQYYVKAWASFEPVEVTSQIMQIFGDRQAEQEYYMVDSLYNVTLRTIKNAGAKALKSNQEKDTYVYLDLYRRLLAIMNYYDAEYAMLHNNQIDAEANYRSAVNYYSDFTLCNYKIAKIFYDKKEYYEAIPPFNEVLKREPNREELFYYIGTCYYFTRQFQQSIFYLEKLLNKVTQYDNLLFYLGESYRLAGDEAKSINYYHDFIINNPEYAPAYLILGDVYRRIGNEDEALKYYLEYLKREQKDISVMTYVALFFAKQKKITEAFQYLDNINKLEPQNPMPFYYKGLIYGELGENNKSISHFIRAAQLGHKRSQALLFEAGISW